MAGAFFAAAISGSPQIFLYLAVKRVGSLFLLCRICFLAESDPVASQENEDGANDYQMSIRCNRLGPQVRGAPSGPVRGFAELA